MAIWELGPDGERGDQQDGSRQAPWGNLPNPQDGSGWNAGGDLPQSGFGDGYEGLGGGFQSQDQNQFGNPFHDQNGDQSWNAQNSGPFENPGMSGGNDPFGNDQPPQPPFQPEPYQPEAAPADYTADPAYAAGQGDPQNESPMDGQSYPQGEAYPEDSAYAEGDAIAFASAEAGAEAVQDESLFDEPEQLDLGDDDVRLPWLEGEDEELEDESGGIGQTMALVVMAFVAIGLLVGGIFWAMQRGKSDEPLVADGGVIEAPKEPYKTRPDNPGGEVVAGTGDTSFAVAEGQSRQPQIDGEKADAPKPGFETVSPLPSQPSPAAATGTPPASGVGVQVGAYSSREAAEAGWTALQSQYEALAGVNHRVLQGQADIGTVYRLQAVPGDLAAAKTLCAGMKAAGLSCQVKN